MTCTIVTTVKTSRKNIDKKKLAIKEKKKVFILGDSIFKFIQEWKITKKIGNKQNVYVRHFSGSKVNCMDNYVKLCIRENNPGHIIFHVGTNDFPLDKDPNSIAQSIIRLAKCVVTDNRDVTVPSITPRND